MMQLQVAAAAAGQEERARAGEALERVLLADPAQLRPQQAPGDRQHEVSDGRIARARFRSST